MVFTGTLTTVLRLQQGPIYLGFIVERLDRCWLDFEGCGRVRIVPEASQNSWVDAALVQ